MCRCNITPKIILAPQTESFMYIHFFVFFVMLIYLSFLVTTQEKIYEATTTYLSNQLSWRAIYHLYVVWKYSWEGVGN